MSDLTERVKAIADKVSAREAKKQSIMDKYKPEKGKTLTVEQRLARIEALLEI